MKAAARTARAMEKIIAQAAKAGHDLSGYTEHKKSIVQEVEIASSVQLPKYYEAEAVLLAIERPSAFMYKMCKREECKEPFGTNYRAVGYCSDNCRAKDLAKVGITWDPTKSPEERWAGEPPLILPPASVKLLFSLIQHALESDKQVS